MLGWQRSALGQLINTQKGYAFKSGWYCNTGRRVVKVSNFTADSIDSTGLICIPESIAADYMKYELQVGDVIVQTVGSWPNNPASVVGKCVRTPQVAAGSLLNQNAVKLSPLVGLNRQFLFYLLKGDGFKSYIIGTAQGAASQAAITLDAVRGYEFYLPPLPVQQRIAGILSSYDELIENSQRRIKILENMARGLYREWFVHFRFPGHENLTCVASALGEIPEGWAVKKLGDLITYSRRATKPGPHLNERRYVPIDCLPQKSLALLEARPTEEAQSSLQLFEKGDILFGAMRPYFHKVAVAPFAGVTRTTCFVLKPVRPEWHAFATMSAFDEATVAYATAHSQGATIPYAVWDGSLSEMPLVLPPTEILQQFEAVVSPMLSRLAQSFFALGNLRRTRDLLLPRLLSGQIKIETT